MSDTLTAVFCVVDDFCRVFEPAWNKRLLESNLKSRDKKGRLSLSEIMTILVSFQLSNHRHLKGYYLFMKKYHSHEFPTLVSYPRFVQIIKSAMIPLVAFFEFVKGEENGIYFIDATAISVCKNKRIYQHKVFKNFAKRGKSTMGWFFGFKFHLIINQDGDPIDFKLTPGNVDDRKPVVELAKNLYGKIFGDKGYISRDLFANLFKDGLHLFTALKKNMKPHVVALEDSKRLSARNLIESTFNVMKNSQHLEHSRHRSPLNFMVNILSVVCAYAMRRLKCVRKNKAMTEKAI
jgi:hypothetical protein